MAPPGGGIYFLFHTNNAKFPPLSPWRKIFGYVQYPRSGAFQKFCGDLKNDLFSDFFLIGVILIDRHHCIRRKRAFESPERFLKNFSAKK